MLAAERKVTSKLLEQDTSAEKLYILNECVSLPLFYILECFLGAMQCSVVHADHVLPAAT